MELALLIGVPILIFGALCYVIYKSDPKGWQYTFRRLSTHTRANIEAKREPKGLTSKDLVNDWDNQFEGKDIVAKQDKPHEIIKTRRTKSTVSTSRDFYWYQWWCRCGKTDRHIGEPAAMRDFNKHLEDVRLEDEHKKKTEEFRKKGLDREW